MIDSNSLDIPGSLVWLATLAVIGFLVSWFPTVKLRLARPPYVGLLALVVAVLTGSYLWWAGLGLEFWTTNWGWGVIGAIVTGGVLGLLIQRVLPREGDSTVGATEIVWDGLVYGAAEALLLSVLPVLVVWQAIGATAGVVVAASLALLASAVVIVAHHLGYPSFRGRKMTQALIGCLPLSIVFLITGSPIAAIGAHAILHIAVLQRGAQLPPTEEYVAPEASRPAVAAI